MYSDMQIKIKDLKELIENCEENSKIYVHIKQYENYEQYNVIKISFNPIQLDFEVKKKHDSTIEISEIKDAIKRYDEDTLIGFMLIEPQYPIQRGGAFDKAQLDKDGNLHLYTYLQPRQI